MRMSKNSNSASNLGAISILLGSQCAVASAAIFAKLALLGAGAVMVAALRLTIAAAITALISKRSKEKIKVPFAHERLFAFCGLALSVHFGTWIASLNLTSVAIATLLVSTTPVWTTLYDVIFLRKRPSPQFWLGFVATIVGAVLAVMNNSGPSTAHTSNEQLLGASLSLLGGFAFACYLVAIRTVSDDYSTLVIVNRTYTWSAVFLWVGVLVGRETLPPMDLTCWGGILGMSLVSQMLGHTGMNLSLKSFTPNIVALSTLLEPVFAAILALMIFQEALSAQMIFGAVLIVAGLTAVISAKIGEPEMLQEAL